MKGAATCPQPQRGRSDSNAGDYFRKLPGSGSTYSQGAFPSFAFMWLQIGAGVHVSTHSCRSGARVPRRCMWDIWQQLREEVEQQIRLCCPGLRAPFSSTTILRLTRSPMGVCFVAAEGAPPCAQFTIAPFHPLPWHHSQCCPSRCAWGSTGQPSFSKLKQFLACSVSHLP